MIFASASRWSQVRQILPVAAYVSSAFLTCYLICWAWPRDRRFTADWGGSVEIRTHPGLFVHVGLLGALPALAGAAIAVHGRRWIGIAVGIACFLLACLFEAAVEYLPNFVLTG
ncbi:hypothetical protein [Pseudofrankia sp. DC12]|uniref:hypothetical protein n=1 Tax=Pseudofrankia sp. DC12 TaxID=683315 RepID=UPI0005F862CB|nr:hypothetical protein [Pseudofrankia sp. DC12]